MDTYIPKHAKYDELKHSINASFEYEELITIAKKLFQRKPKKFTVTEPARNNFTIELSTFEAADLVKLNMPSLLANRFVEAKCVFHAEDGAYFRKSDAKFLECFARRMAEKAK